MGALNYYVGGRGRHFRDVEGRIARLLEDLDAQHVDHALCTGDVTQMSFDLEFERCAALFGSRLSDPEHHTVLPGNHDRYTSRAEDERRFERWFGALAGDCYPYAKRLAPDVTLVALDVARPTGYLDSSGWCGAGQIAEARALLTDPSLHEQFVVLGLHYGLLRANGKPDSLAHGIRDYRAILELVDSDDVRVDLVLHGHIHRAYRTRTAKCPVGCAGSATDLYVRCGYDIYDIDVQRRSFSVERRCWDGRVGGYVPGPENIDEQEERRA